MNYRALVTATLAAMLRQSSALVTPALGESASEQSGVINVGIEGYMLMGAVAAYAAAVATGNAWLGIGVGVLVGAAISLIHAYISVTLKLNQIISGMVLWLLGMGLSAYIFRTMGIKEEVAGFAAAKIPVLSKLPVVGPILFQQNAMFYISLLLVCIFAFMQFRTTFGLTTKATGGNPLAVDMAGHSVSLIRYINVLICGAMSGFGGAYLSLAVAHRFSEDMTAGRGFIAICVVVFGRWNPWAILGGSFLFAGVDALQMQLQALSVPVPYPLLLMLPYVVTIGVLVGVTIFSKRTYMPRKLAIPYIKGEA